MSWLDMNVRMARILVPVAPWKIETIEVLVRGGSIYRARITNCGHKGRKPRIMERETIYLLAAAIALEGYAKPNPKTFKLSV